MKQTLLVAGLACLVGAIVGGGLKGFGIEVPAFGSRVRQVMLGFLGVVLILVGVIAFPEGDKAGQAVQPAVDSPRVPEPIHTTPPGITPPEKPAEKPIPTPPLTQPPKQPEVPPVGEIPTPTPPPGPPARPIPYQPPPEPPKPHFISVYSVPRDKIIQVPEGSECIIEITCGGFYSEAAALKGLSEISFSVKLDGVPLKASNLRSIRKDPGGQWHVCRRYRTEVLQKDRDYVLSAVTYKGRNKERHRQKLDSRRLTMRVKET